MKPFAAPGTFGLSKKGRLCLFFSKEEYAALPEAKKYKVRNSCVFDKQVKAWVSRSRLKHVAAERAALLVGLERSEDEGVSADPASLRAALIAELEEQGGIENLNLGLIDNMLL